MTFRQDGRADKKMFFTQTKSKSYSSKRLNSGGHRNDENPSGRRAMRNLVRFRNRKAGLFYDGTPFTGPKPDRFFHKPDKISLVPDEHVRERTPVRPKDAIRTEHENGQNSRGSGYPLQQPLQDSQEFCKNSEVPSVVDSPVKSPSTPTCPHCGENRVVGQKFSRCSQCHELFVGSSVQSEKDKAMYESRKMLLESERVSPVTSTR